VPFTLSVMRVLLVESHGMLLAIPKESIEELLILENAQILKTATQEILNWVDQLVPLISLNPWLQFNCSRKAINTEVLPIINQESALLISQGTKLFAVKIDRCWGEQEVAVRQIQGDIKLPVGFAGCTILGDGRVLPLVDIPSLLQWLTNVSDPNSNMSKLNITDQTNLGGNNQITQDYALEKNTILIIDDSINVRRFLALSLEKAGYQVEQAKDGQEAIEKLMGGLKVQFVICDIEMPRLDGYGFLSKVKSDNKFKNLPIAMLTSRSGDKHRQLAINLGASAYFSKPYKEQELIQTIQELMSKQLMRV
ncbi:MAG TPA: response regulator, partial [Allocoleopsis sp.]